MSKRFPALVEEDETVEGCHELVKELQQQQNDGYPGRDKNIYYRLLLLLELLSLLGFKMIIKL